MERPAPFSEVDELRMRIDGLESEASLAKAEADGLAVELEEARRLLRLAHEELGRRDKAVAELEEARQAAHRYRAYPSNERRQELWAALGVLEPTKEPK